MLTLTNEELIQIIKNDNSTEKRDAAWEQLLKQSPSNYDLRYIIEYTEKRDAAWEQLLKQSPDNDDLRYIIEYTEKRDAAWEQLLKQLGVTERVDEELLIKQIAKEVVSRPGSLKMDSWHCGTSHCLAGWATVLSPVAQKIESDTDTETAGCAVLPSYARYFFSSNDVVFEMLQKIAATE